MSDLDGKRFFPFCTILFVIGYTLANHPKPFLDCDHEFSYFSKNQVFSVRNDDLGYTSDISIVKTGNKPLLDGFHSVGQNLPNLGRIPKKLPR